MKNIIKNLLALMLIVSMVFAITSCGFGPKPNLDLEDAADNLEDEDYRVSYYDDPDDISEPGVEEYLRATSYDRDGHTKDTLTVYVFETSKAAKLFYQYQKIQHDNYIEELKHEIKMAEYQLKEFGGDLDDDDYDDAEDYIEELKEDLEKTKSEYVLGRKGKTVWYGTKDAIKDSKG